MLSNRHFKRCFGDVLESAVTRLPPYASEGRGFNPGKTPAASSGQGFNPAKKSGAASGRGFNPAENSGATRIPFGGLLAEPSANLTGTVTLRHPS